MAFASFRRFANGRGALALATFVGVAAGMAGGWIWHGAYASAREQPNKSTCRDEVASIDNALGRPVSCSSSDMTSEVKDSYLVCKCKKK
jgi:hypothetical protein